MSQNGQKTTSHMTSLTRNLQPPTKKIPLITNQYYRAKIGRHYKTNLIICKLYHYQAYQNYHFFSPTLNRNFD